LSKEEELQKNKNALRLFLWEVLSYKATC